MAIASLVLGILGLLTAGSASIGALILNILAIVFGAIGKGGDRPKMAKAGFVMGIIGVVVTLMGVLINPLATSFLSTH